MHWADERTLSSDAGCQVSRCVNRNDFDCQIEVTHRSLPAPHTHSVLLCEHHTVMGDRDKSGRTVTLAASDIREKPRLV